MPSGFLGGGMGPRAMGHQGLPNPVPVAGAELLTNGDFSSATGWTAGGWEITGGLAVATAEARFSGPYRTVASTRYSWLQVAAEVVTIASGAVIIANRSVSTGNVATPGVAFATGRGDTADSNFYLGVNVEPVTGTFSNATCKELALSSLFSTRAYASADCDLSAAVSRTAGTQAGLCARLDSATSPANFLIAYLDGAGNVKVDKCVGGVYTNVISGAITYAAGYILRLVCSGTSVSAYYNGTQVGSTVTVSDAGIVSNTRHGKFSTYAANSINSYTIA